MYLEDKIKPMQIVHWRRRRRWSHNVEVKGQVFVWSGWSGCIKEEIKDRHGCGIHAKSNRFYRVGPGSLKQTLVQQSYIFHGLSSLWPIAHKYNNFLAMEGQCEDSCAWETFSDIWSECISVKVKVLKSFFFVSVLQWIKDALIEKHLFMISGTICDWTADGALDCGISNGSPRAPRAFF